MALKDLHVGDVVETWLRPSTMHLHGPLTPVWDPVVPNLRRYYPPGTYITVSPITVPEKVYLGR